MESPRNFALHSSHDPMTVGLFSHGTFEEMVVGTRPARSRPTCNFRCMKSALGSQAATARNIEILGRSRKTGLDLTEKMKSPSTIPWTGMTAHPALHLG